MRLLVVLLVGITAIVAANPAAGATHIVTPDGSGDFPDIQSAIDAAVGGDVVELADGTFAGTGNRDLDFHGKAITIRSSSGDPAFCLIDCGGAPGDRHRAFHFHTGEGVDSVVRDFTVTNGYHEYGGAIRCDASNPFILNVVLSRNRVINSGGGLYCDGSSPTLQRVVFEADSSDYVGGAAACQGGSPRFQDCILKDNYANHAGGAIEIHAGTDLSFEDCDFVGNIGGFGAAVCVNSSSMNMTQCLLSGNQGYIGGGVCCSDSELEISGCTFAANGASGRGGGIWSRFSSSVIVQNSIIAFSSPGEGAGCDNDGTVALICCDIYGNEHGDWVYCIADQLGQSGNIHKDPVFCSQEHEDLRLQTTSPCLPESTGCGLMGAREVGCGNVTGGCCFPDKTCQILTETSCTAADGTYQGNYTDCDPNPCNLPGACCFGTMCLMLPEDYCWANFGTFQGDDTVCNPNPYPTSDVTANEADLHLVLIVSPNPSTGSVTIRYGLPVTGPAHLDLFDASGRRVRQIHAGTENAGGHVVSWDGTDDAGRQVPSGIYFVRLVSEAGVITKPVLLAR